MRSFLLSFLFAFVLFCPSLAGALPACDSVSPPGNGQSGKNKDKAWSMVPLPSVLYNTDIGFQFGALVDVFYYGKGRPYYPEYLHHLYAEVSLTTKGGGIYQLFYDSPRLIRKIRTTADVTYLTEKALDFYGFNGYEAVYDHSWEEDEDSLYRTRMFYRVQRKFLRIGADFQGRFCAENLRWLAGAAWLQVVMDSVDVDRLNKGKKEENKLPEVPGLYSYYCDWGLLDKKERDGGINNYLKLGLVYDTRDNESTTGKGIWSEVIFLFAPGFLGDGDFSFIRLAATHRQYFTLVPNDLFFAYRIGYLGTIAGKTPFYFLPYMIRSYALTTTIDGLGGSQSVRGILRDRVVGDGTAFLNTELRWKLWDFRFLGSDWFMALNLFGDAGMVVQKHPVDLQSIPDGIQVSDYFSDAREYPHVTLGGGVHFSLNQKTVITAEVGKALDPRDGNLGVYVGIGWLF